MSVFDAAEYILKSCGPMSAMKLQKLVYYSQAWSLVWDDKPLFNERIEAWANGPVCPDLYNRHRGRFEVRKGEFLGSDNALSTNQQDTVDRVLEFYGKKSAHWLSELTHIEDPWADARGGLTDGERGNHEIGHAAMVEYYSSLQ